jgi:hypothetical protein
MNSPNALDGLLTRAVTVERVEPLDIPDWQLLIGGSGGAVVCGLLAAIVPSPESIEHGWVIAAGAGFEATLAGLLHGYGLTAAALSALSLLTVFGFSRLPGEGPQALSLIALIAWLGATAALIGATGLFLAIAALNVLAWLALATAALVVLGLLGGRR